MTQAPEALARLWASAGTAPSRARPHAAVAAAACGESPKRGPNPVGTNASAASVPDSARRTGENRRISARRERTPFCRADKSCRWATSQTHVDQATCPATVSGSSPAPPQDEQRPAFSLPANVTNRFAPTSLRLDCGKSGFTAHALLRDPCRRPSWRGCSGSGPRARSWPTARRGGACLRRATQSLRRCRRPGARTPSQRLRFPTGMNAKRAGVAWTGSVRQRWAHSCTHTNTHTQSHTNTHTNTRAYTYKYTQTHTTHTHTHTHTTLP
jgi:hypothetical protein